jgi:hypothetical protein
VRAALLLLALPIPAGATFAQAPPSAGLWRVAAASLTTPAALSAGATAPFWNPAATAPGNLVAGFQIVETSDVVGLRGLLVAVTKVVGPRIEAGLVLARMDVRDLVRTTTSPSGTLGSIPVYDQMVAGRVRARLAGVQVGAMLRLHDSRFDFIRDGGVTVDLGARYELTSRLVIAGTTHFLPADLGGEETTDYYAGVEYVVVRAARLAGVTTRIMARYGLSYRPSGDVEHALGGGASFADHVRVDVLLAREQAYGDAAWRPAFGVEILIGRYGVTFARSLGINDVGGTYRIGLDVAFIE